MSRGTVVTGGRMSPGRLRLFLWASRPITNAWRLHRLLLFVFCVRNGRARMLRRGHKHARRARSGGVVLRVCPGRGIFWWREAAPRLFRAAARVWHTKKQARRATRTAGAASCVAALVGLGQAGFQRSFSSLIAHRGPICVVLITAHWGLAPLTRGRGQKLETSQRGAHKNRSRFQAS